MIQTRRIHPNLVVADPFEHQADFSAAGSMRSRYALRARRATRFSHLWTITPAPVTRYTTV
jgi:hypothetical protein